MNPSLHRHRFAFTLVEILLVMLVIAIAVAAFLPTALNGADQARTRSFLRQVISLNQYARSRAVLDRTPIAVVYDIEAGLVSLKHYGVSPVEQEKDSGLEVPLEEGAGDPTLSVRQRRVPQTMRIREVEGALEREGQYWVVMESDGIGPSYEVEIVDPRGEPRRLSFNGFTGEVDEIN